jgi:hypothetical protein
MIDRIDENMVILIVASPNPKWQNHPNCLFTRVIYTFFENKGTEDFRKESLFVLNPADHLVNLTVTPTSLQSNAVPNGNDYGNKYTTRVEVLCD